MGAEAVIFDLDGVLVDSADLWYSMQKISFKKYANKEIGFDEWKSQFWGKDSTKMYSILGLSEEKINEAIGWQNAYLLQNINKIKLIDSAEFVLENIRETKMKIGLLSNNKKTFLIEVLKHFGLSDFFDCIVGDEIEPKPSPKGLLKSLETLGVEKEKAFFVGDTETDLKTGQSAGVKTIIVGKDVKSLLEVPAFITWNSVRYF